ncbi:hypothetical protein EON62_06215 [archaeon]|nr:MAG: hypothetical protein EON62_06215 [archaeon]
MDDHAAGSSGSGSEAGTGQPTRLEASSSLSAPAAASPTGMKGRLVVVANRLPISVSQDAAGKYNFKMSSGGLVSALVSVRDKLQFIWIGWLGKEIPEKDQPMIRERLLKEYSCLPVFISDDLADLYYSGYAARELLPRACMLTTARSADCGTSPFSHPPRACAASRTRSCGRASIMSTA